MPTLKIALYHFSKILITVYIWSFILQDKSANGRKQVVVPGIGVDLIQARIM
jgi:hypothetical protein